MNTRSIAIGILTAALFAAPAFAVETDYDGGSRALPLQQEGGTARAMAMGSAVVAIDQGSASLLWNPAGLSRMSCTEVGLHHNTGLGDTIQEIAVIGMPLGKVHADGRGGSLGGIAVSLGYVDYGSFQGRDASGAQTGSYSAGDYSGSVGYGRRIGRKLSAGITLKANQSMLGGKAYTAYGSDLGLMYALKPKLDLGLTYTNVRLGSKIGGNGLASGWRLGLGWKKNRNLILGLSGEMQPDGVDRFQVGAEYLVGNPAHNDNVLALRAGYSITTPDPSLGGLAGLTVGLGYTLTKGLVLDYAMLPAGELGASHRLSLTFKFHCPEKHVAMRPPPVADKPIVVELVVLEDSHFDFDKSELRPEGMAALRKNLADLEANPNTNVRIAGYTSASGTQKYNQKLSERRAEAVENFLLDEGIDATRLSTIGYGEDRPATHEATPANLGSNAAKSNMRVLFEVTVK